jgi:peptidoglycan/LPS O-acetylase OafA/YrhL
MTVASAAALPGETPAASDTVGRFARVDELRGFAAVVVVLCHMSVSTYVGAPNAGQAPLPWLGLVLGFGYLGVPLFFVVSGFCIHWPQARASHAGRAETPRWGAFFQRRFWRLYPPYILCLAATILLLLVTTGAWPVGLYPLLAQIGLVHTLDPRTFLGLNPPSWTLAVEAQLYLAYPVVFLLTRRLGPWRAVAAILLLTLLYRLALTFVPLPADYGQIGWEVFLGRWFEWTAGALVAEWAAGNVRVPERLTTWWIVAPIVAAAIYVGEYHFWHYGIYIVREPLYGVVFALVLLAALRQRRAAAPSAIAAWLGGIGVWSYSLYLVHRPVQLAFEPLARRIAALPFVIEHRVPTSLLLFAATTPLILWLARVFYRWCEAPFIRTARGIGRAPKDGATGAASRLPRLA